MPDPKTAEGQLNDLRVLLVEDNRSAGVILSRLLESWGCQVQTCRSLDNYLHQCDGFVPRVVIVDFRLPISEGLEIGRAIRRRPSTANAVLIALTAYDEHQDEYEDAGFDHLLIKPPRPGQLKILLKSIAEG